MKPPKRKKATLECITLRCLETEGGTQTRVAIDQPTVDAYVAAIEAGAELPPPEIYGPDADGVYWIGDGFHRAFAYSVLDHETLVCAVRPGGFREALTHSLSANDGHGLRRSRADKENAVRMALAEWPDLSTSSLAGLCAVGRELAERVRQEMPRPRPTSHRGNSQEYEDMLPDAAPPVPEKRRGLDGREYPASLDLEALARRRKEEAAEELLPANYEVERHLWDGESRGALAPFSPLVDVNERPLPEEIKSDVDYRGIPTWGELLKGRGVIPVSLAHDDSGSLPGFSAAAVLVNRRFAIDAIQTMEPPLRLFRAKPISPRQADKIAGQKDKAEEDLRRKKWLLALAEAVFAAAQGRSMMPPFYKLALSGVVFAVAQMHPAGAEWADQVFRVFLRHATREPGDKASPAEWLVKLAPSLDSGCLLSLLHVAALAYDVRENGKAGVLVAAAIRDLGVEWPADTAEQGDEELEEEIDAFIDEHEKRAASGDEEGGEEA